MIDQEERSEQADNRNGDVESGSLSIEDEEDDDKVEDPLYECLHDTFSSRYKQEH